MYVSVCVGKRREEKEVQVEKEEEKEAAAYSHGSGGQLLFAFEMRSNKKLAVKTGPPKREGDEKSKGQRS